MSGKTPLVLALPRARSRAGELVFAGPKGSCLTVWLLGARPLGCVELAWARGARPRDVSSRKRRVRELFLAGRWVGLRGDEWAA